jgi:L-fuconolactonase
VVGWVPLVDEDLPKILDRLKPRAKLKGVRHVIQDEPDDNFILREDFNRGIEALSEIGLVYDILIHERHLPPATAFVGRHPQQTFVLDHLAKPLIKDGVIEPWQQNLLRLAQHENVFCKLSGLVTEANWTTWTLENLRPYMDSALEAFGPARLMAGSDWPVCLLASSYKKWWSVVHEWCASLSHAEREMILGENSSRVYRLSA